MAFLAESKPAIVAMEACGSADFWARTAARHGHEVRIIPTQYVKPYVKRHKNDAADAAAICEAACRQTMRFVPAKTEQQQSLQASHRVRTRLIRDRTALVNEIRGLLAEFGLVFPNSVRVLRSSLASLLSEETDDVPVSMRGLLADLARDLDFLDRRIEETNKRIDKIIPRRHSVPC